jgi:hypothetical protein
MVLWPLSLNGTLAEWIGPTNWWITLVHLGPMHTATDMCGTPLCARPEHVRGYARMCLDQQHSLCVDYPWASNMGY